MATQSPAQKANWERFFVLGTLTSLSQWIISKQRVVEHSHLDPEKKARILRLMKELSAELWEGAKSLGWKPK